MSLYIRTVVIVMWMRGVTVVCTIVSVVTIVNTTVEYTVVVEKLSCQKGGFILFVNDFVLHTDSKWSTQGKNNTVYY